MTGPLSIGTCSWETLIAELGDPLADRGPVLSIRPRTGTLPTPPTAGATVWRPSHADADTGPIHLPQVAS